MEAIKQHCPKAELVLDRFHVVKALDEVGKQQWREASAQDRISLKGLRWLLYRHSSSRFRQNTATLKALEKGNRRIYRAWRLKDEFEQFWEYKARWAAERFLKRWTMLRSKAVWSPCARSWATVPQTRRRNSRFCKFAPDQCRGRRPQPNHPNDQEPGQWIPIAQRLRQHDLSLRWRPRYPCADSMQIPYTYEFHNISL